MYTYGWFIEVWQKTIKFCKILQLKNKVLKTNKKKMLPQTEKQLSLDFLLCEVIKCFYCINHCESFFYVQVEIS